MKGNFFFYAIIILLFIIIGVLIRPVFWPCPSYEDIQVKTDTLVTVIHDTVSVPPVIETFIKRDTIYYIEESNTYITNYKKDFANASVEMDIYAHCPVDSVNLMVKIFPLVNIRETMVISSDTIRTVVIEKPVPFIKKINYGIIGGFMTAIIFILIK